MKMRIIFAVENHILSSQLMLKSELCKVGHSAKQPHFTNEETKAQREAELLAHSAVYTVFSELRSLLDKRVVERY